MSDRYRGDEAGARALHEKGGEPTSSSGQPKRTTTHARCALPRASRICSTTCQHLLHPPYSTHVAPPVTADGLHNPSPPQKATKKSEADIPHSSAYNSSSSNSKATSSEQSVQ